MKRISGLLRLNVTILSIPSAGRTEMKQLNATVKNGLMTSFNTLSGSYRDEAARLAEEQGNDITFNTLSGSYRDEAPASDLIRKAQTDLSIPSAGRTEMKLWDSSVQQGLITSFNTLSGSYRDEALWPASLCLIAAILSIPSAGRTEMKHVSVERVIPEFFHFQYPQRVVPR